MGPTVQLVVVGVVVVVAGLYVARAAWKTWFGRSPKGCGSGCGKCVAPQPNPNPPGRFSLPQL